MLKDLKRLAIACLGVLVVIGILLVRALKAVFCDYDDIEYR